jgi:hypothetical protein
MPFEIIEAHGSLIIVRIKGLFTKDDLNQMQTRAAEVIKKEGKIRILAILENFLGWEKGGDWEDMTFQLEHDNDIEKMAIVGEEEWRDLVSAFLGKPFRPFAIEYFEPSQLDRARAWLD